MTSGESRRVGVAELWRMLDLITPMALRVAATLRIADLIAEGHTGLPELSARAGVPSDSLSRLLRYLTVRGVFTELSSNEFALNDLAALLLDEHPDATRRWLCSPRSALVVRPRRMTKPICRRRLPPRSTR